MVRRELQPGDPVIYRKMKRSESPGPRAIKVHPTPKGEEYLYEVDKFWTVAETRGDQLLLVTRRGKQHLVDRKTPHLRRPNWVERWLYRDRFPRLEECLAQLREERQEPSAT
ncbi:MAG: hypothetical protein KY475_12925 [Planctomycetes bacterium]|nr:hypothetical protein [Planctomycetota bacterium]